MDLTVASSRCYKCFFETLSSAEAPMLASLSWNGSKGKPLKEYRGKRWYHANWAAKYTSKQTWRFRSEVISGRSVDKFQDLPRRFGRRLTCKQSNRYNILLVGLSGPTFYIHGMTQLPRIPFEHEWAKFNYTILALGKWLQHVQRK